ncbi:hypothetical protein J1N35_026099 [Gossypium stocksii]|uniref:RRM domain-containing protein n=1 Tax=Gossypium stocksii TaxID=47602 RepID=A0A9D3ZYB9_9ROSI|nr:hypothetical protein J1N35_026099 [Gossypium stocksii]
MRPVFVGNFEYETRQSELERLFSKYGRIERVDMKSGTYTKGKRASIGARHLSAKKTSIAMEIFMPSCSPATHTDGIILHFLHSIMLLLTLPHWLVGGPYQIIMPCSSISELPAV